jgi:hypothetical protein
MATNWTKAGRSGVNWQQSGDAGTTNWNGITGDFSNVWNEDSSTIPTNWNAVTGTDVDWGNVGEPIGDLPDQFPFMADDLSFYFGSSLDFGMEYDTTTEEFQITTSGGEKAFGITKTKVVSLASISEAPSTSDTGNLAYVNGKLMVKEEEV